jgi:cytochrome b561
MRASGRTAPIDTDGASQRWGAPTVVLHWLSAGLILVLLGLGWFMVHGDVSAATKFDLYQLHKSLGFLSLGFLLLRLGARLAQPAPQAPPAMPHWERRAAGLTHATFYVLMLASIFSGWLLASAAIIAIPMRFFGLFVVPTLVAPNDALSAKMVILHYIVSRLLLGLLVLHVGAALKHHLLDRDDVLRRMVRLR